MADIQKNKRRKKQSKENEFLIQGAILAAAAVIVKIIGALYRIPLTNIIGDEGNGFLGYAYEIYAMALMLSSFSLPIAVSKLVSTKMAMHQPRNAFRIFKCAMMFAVSVGAVVALAIFLGADMISRHLMESPLSVYTLKVLAPALFIVGSARCNARIFSGNGNYGSDCDLPGFGADHQCNSQYRRSQHHDQSGDGSCEKAGQSFA